MAGNSEFLYRDIQLYKSQSLGSGSYGGVCKAKCDGLICAAKIMHPTLFDLRDPGVFSYLRKFQEECHLLSLARHPNVVQYLATYHDPDTKLPVLLMELCDESLTAFLERFPGPLPYHIQLNICHDISLGLVYLHSNGLIHRDLTGNNILMIAGSRAKITDFGMSKLATVNPRMTALTLCPGNVQYMSPEALDEAKTYTAKLDVFSFGVLAIQICTRQSPNPTDRLLSIKQPIEHKDGNNEEEAKEIREIVPETKRRRGHLLLIPDTHTLKPLALQCLKKENQRPTALELTDKLDELKLSSQYKESMQLDQQCWGKKGKSEFSKRAGIEADAPNATMEKVMQLQAVIQEKDKIIETKQKQLLELQQSLKESGHEFTASGDQAEQQRLPPELAWEDIKQMTWRKGTDAPQRMFRGAAIVHGNTAYFRPADSNKLYAYKKTEQWSELPENRYWSYSLTVIDGFVTSVGGGYTSTLLSLTGEDENRQWSEKFPPMSTPRNHATCITTDKILVVAGGHQGSHDLDTVEVMTVKTKQWCTTSSLPHKLSLMSGVLWGNTLVLAGGSVDSVPSKSVFSCALPESDLLRRTGSTILRRRRRTLRGHMAWKEIAPLPASHSTLVSYRGHLLAVGGNDESECPTANVYIYDSHTDSWNVVSQMRHERSSCFAVTSHSGSLIVVGGHPSSPTCTLSVEILE